MLSATFVAYFGPAIANFRRTQPLGCGQRGAADDLSLHAPAMATALVPQALTGRPFTTNEARSHGVSKHALQSRPWRRVFRDVWCHVDLPDTRATRLAAARLVLPAHAVLCGLTAAWVHGADVRRDDDLDVHVGFPKGRRLRPRDGLAVCQETLDESDWLEIDGVRVTTPLRTTFDCLRWLRGVERLVVADALTHAGLVTLPELQAYFSSKRRLGNLRIAELLLADTDPLTESPMETRLRFVLVDGGLPRPVAQHDIFRGDDGTFIGRADFAYPEHKVVVEYDGAWHWVQRRADERRRTAMRLAGWVVLVFDADDVYGDPDRVVRDVRAALRARQLTPARPVECDESCRCGGRHGRTTSHSTFRGGCGAACGR